MASLSNVKVDTRARHQYLSGIQNIVGLRWSKCQPQWECCVVFFTAQLVIVIYAKTFFFQVHDVWRSSPLPSSLLLCNPGFRSHLLHFAAKLKHPVTIIMHLLHILPLLPNQRSNASVVQVYYKQNVYIQAFHCIANCVRDAFFFFITSFKFPQVSGGGVGCLGKTSYL